MVVVVVVVICYLLQSRNDDDVVLIYLIDSFDKPNYMLNPFIVVYVMLAIRDTILICFSLYNILFNKYVSQANKSGKFFIFLSSLMVVFYIYDLSHTWAYIFYIATVLMLFISTIEYIIEYKKVINR